MLFCFCFGFRFFKVALFRTPKILENVASKFVISLSLSDFIFCCVLPIQGYGVASGNFFTNDNCSIFGPLIFANYGISVYNFLLISVHNYVLICHNKKYNKVSYRVNRFYLFLYVSSAESWDNTVILLNHLERPSETLHCI